MSANLREPVEEQVEKRPFGSPPVLAGGRRPAVSASQLLLLLQAASLLAMVVIVATKLWQDHIWLGFLLLGIAAAAWSPEVTRRRFRVWWFAYVAGIFLYTLLRSFADETAIPIQTLYVIRDTGH